MDSSEKDIKNAIFHFKCTRKGKKKEAPYEGFLLEKFLLLRKDGETKIKYEMPIDLSSHIKWEVREDTLGGKKTYTLASFKFQQIKMVQGKHVAKIIIFGGHVDDLLELKNCLRNKIIFQRIQDFYTPLQTLGKGSSSRVLLVRHKTTEQYYAAKCVDKTYIHESEHGLESMCLEIEIQHQMEHPSFIKLYEVYEGDNTFYMVMDLLEGKSLHDELSNHKNGFPIEIAKMMIFQILSGIEYMHGKNVMHRDLKPENIMLLRKGDLNSLKIVDFGLATYCNVDKFFFPKCGTPGYVAPEIANLTDKSKIYDKVCDVFSIGKDLFPGSGFNLVLKLNKQCKIDLTPLQMKKIPQPLISLISKMLEKDPTQRPNASDILKDPFFANLDINKISQSQSDSTAKKAFFAGLKESNQKISQTTDFAGKSSESSQDSGDIPSDESMHQKPGKTSNPFSKSLGLGLKSKKQEQTDDNVGSLRMNDNAFKGLNLGGKKPMAKFNTSEFGQYDLSKPQQQVMRDIKEEEEEHK